LVGLFGWVKPYVSVLTLVVWWTMECVLRVRRRGVVLIPRRLREGDYVIAEVVEGGFLLRRFEPVRVDRGLVEELLGEELWLGFSFLACIPLCVLRVLGLLFS